MGTLTGLLLHSPIHCVVTSITIITIFCDFPHTSVYKTSNINAIAIIRSDIDTDKRLEDDMSWIVNGLNTDLQ